ncbi:hypothetical protein [Nocardia otitidiscaviarum]|uniref:hypothetical protein n=1 Tax=Nocardia otitidiscaviarum TaxID=1823 RepID=UPI0004A6B52F|nr:hypothetical protein [Nocardia otitidiscaviarum]
MFDNGSTGTPSIRRHVDPPRPVTVDISKALPSGGTRFAANSLPLHVRAEGLDLSGLRPGLLYAWARTTTGGWLGFVQVTITTGNGRDKLTLRQWFPESALSPRQDTP